MGRPSSERNAIFLRARVAAARGELERAESLCREAAAHPHRWQGGDGLLLWGDVLSQLGRPDHARDAWRLALERDPQSTSAAMCRARLEAKSAGSNS
jgi:tetratricopeptide (TPR) repeat protein